MRVVTSMMGLLVLAGCDLLPAQMPSIAHKQDALVESPSQQMMAAYYCPKVVPDVGFPGSAAIACAYAFQQAPSQSEMNVGFKSTYTVNNPNHFPIPVAELLTAVTVFPSETNQQLGASCVVFCAEGDTSCTGEPGPASCKSTDEDIKSMDDFTNTAGNLLIRQGVQLATGQAPGFTLPQMNANAESDLSALFAFGPEPLLTALHQLAVQSVNQLAAGQEITFSIPYRLEGTVWLDVGSLGKVPLAFGPIDGTFVIPAQELVSGF